MKEDTTYPEEHSLQGVTESFRGATDNLARARCNRYTANHGSFLLKDGRYAYRDHVWMDGPKREFYHILSIEDEEILRFLDYWDKLEEKQNRGGGTLSATVRATLIKIIFRGMMRMKKVQQPTR